MARADPERPMTEDPDTESATDAERQFIDLLGPFAGPEAYQHMVGIIALLDNAPVPPLSQALRTYLSEHGIDQNLAVADGRGSMTIAHDAVQARQLRHSQLYRRVIELGETTLRAPQ